MGGGHKRARGKVTAKQRQLAAVVGEREEVHVPARVACGRDYSSEPGVGGIQFEGDVINSIEFGLVHDSVRGLRGGGRVGVVTIGA